MGKSIKFSYEVLIDLRKKSNLSQEGLAEIIGVSRQTISKWETGEKIPDLDNINKLCKEFKVDINKFVEGIYETEKKNLDNNTTNKKSFAKKIIIAVVIIYLLAVLPKAILFSYILYKNDESHIDSYGYTYNQDAKMNETRISRSRIVYRKDDIEHQIDSSGMTDVYTADTETWMFINDKEYYEYRKGKEFKDNIEKEYYDYRTGVVYTDTTPFEYIKVNKYKFGIWQILNPFKFYKINDKGEMIVPLDDEGSKMYIDIKTGYLNKVKSVTGEDSYINTVYMGIQVNDIEDSQVELNEDMKNEIIEKSKQ